MNRKIIWLGAMLMLCYVEIFPAWADSASYTPPAQKGDIYVVLQYKPGAINDLAIKAPTKVSVTWGSFKKSETVKPHIMAGVPMGFVLKLKHTKADSIPLTVETDGKIEKKPLQGAPPPQWNNKAYRQVSW
jgi:hypothetical protein